MTHDPLVTFIYTLMRDELPTGAIEEVMTAVRACATQDVTYSAPHLEAYATELAAEILGLRARSMALRGAP